MSEKKKDQFVIAYLPNFEQSNVVVSHTVRLAQMLNKGIILLHINDPRYHQSIDNAEKQLQSIKESLDKELSVSYISLNGDSQVIIEALPSRLNGVVAVAAVDAKATKKSPCHPKEVLRNFANSKIAYLTVQEPCTCPKYEHICLSIDYHRESKEKLIWSSYFARFDNSQVHVLYHDYKDEGLRQKWYNNMQFLNKFFNNLNIGFLPHIVAGNAGNTDADSIPFAHEKGYQLMVCVTTKEKDLLDSILGSQESKTIKNEYKIPILFINPREDIYVLCD